MNVAQRQTGVLSGNLIRAETVMFVQNGNILHTHATARDASASAAHTRRFGDFFAIRSYLLFNAITKAMNTQS
jgi:hypothetical protein